MVRTDIGLKLSFAALQVKQRAECAKRLTSLDLHDHIAPPRRPQWKGAAPLPFMSTRSLPSLAHALSVAPDLDAALVALGEALSESDRSAIVGVFRYDGRRDMLRERLRAISRPKPKPAPPSAGPEKPSPG